MRDRLHLHATSSDDSDNFDEEIEGANKSHSSDMDVADSDQHDCCEDDGFDVPFQLFRDQVDLPPPAAPASLSAHAEFCEYPPGSFTTPQLDDHRKALRYPAFTNPQGQVCDAILRNERDVVFLAPCAFGKSLCFAIPARAMGGITVSLSCAYTGNSWVSYICSACHSATPLSH